MPLEIVTREARLLRDLEVRGFEGRPVLGAELDGGRGEPWSRIVGAKALRPRPGQHVPGQN